jgi:hypothetical protein
MVQNSDIKIKYGMEIKIPPVKNGTEERVPYKSESLNKKR